MLILTAFTSLLFAIPAALLKCRFASTCFAALVPVSFTVHALGGKQWSLNSTPAGRYLVLADKAVAQVAAAVTIYRVTTADFVVLYTLPFIGALGTVFLMYYVYYPKPPKCWVAHHATFHVVVVAGTICASALGA